MKPPLVRAAGPHDEAAAVAVITLAFCNDPIARWAVPDPDGYLEATPKIARAFGGNGFTHGTVDFAEGGLGAAMWLPPGVEPDYETMMSLLETHSPPERLPAVLAVLDAMGQYHPGEAHWYLPMIGVDPAWQCRGIGSALMQYSLARIDAAHAVAYLESSNPRNISLYQRHGFVSVGQIQQGDSPTIVAMVRSAR